MKISIVLQNAKTLDEAIEIIKKGTSEYYPYQLAAQYAYDAAECKFDRKEIEAHLSILAEHGVTFNWQQTIDEAMLYHQIED